MLLYNKFVINFLCGCRNLLLTFFVDVASEDTRAPGGCKVMFIFHNLQILRKDTQRYRDIGITEYRNTEIGIPE